MNSLRGSTLSPIRSEKTRSGVGVLVDRHALKRARRRVHRRLAQLVGIHLAEALKRWVLMPWRNSSRIARGP